MGKLKSKQKRGKGVIKTEIESEWGCSHHGYLLGSLLNGFLHEHGWASTILSASLIPSGPTTPLLVEAGNLCPRMASTGKFFTLRASNSSVAWPLLARHCVVVGSGRQSHIKSGYEHHVMLKYREKTQRFLKKRIFFAFLWFLHHFTFRWFCYDALYRFFKFAFDQKS
jgi:hypothetical protein